MAFRVAIVGSGNIGTDLMYKVGRCRNLELVGVAGIDPNSEGLARARRFGCFTTHRGLADLLENVPDVALVFDATSAHAHEKNLGLLQDAGIRSVDLTPASIGPPVVPPVNLQAHTNAVDISLITCGAQATVPVVAAIRRVAHMPYAEIVATIASKSAGPGTRQNIDEFTRATARGLETVGGADQAKALIILNPAEPPIMMRNTVYATIDDGVEADLIRQSISEIVADVARYVPGYRLKAAPIIEGDLVTALLEVTGAGDYLPIYAGNLDIMTSAAVRVAELLATESNET